MSDKAPSGTPLYFPFMAGFYARVSNLAYPMIRSITGLVLMPHGARKLFGWFGGSTEGSVAGFTRLGLEPALPLVYLVGTVEFLGGLCLVVGLWTRPVAAAVAVIMAMAIFAVHLDNGFFWGNRGFEYPLLWGIVALAIFFRGGGKLSLDARIGKEF